VDSPCVSSHMSLLLNSTSSSAFRELYSGIDFSSLSWFEQEWASWYIWVGNPVIATGLLAFVVHEVSFLIFGRDDVDQLNSC
jgi:methylsterol monooxygenase